MYCEDLEVYVRFWRVMRSRTRASRPDNQSNKFVWVSSPLPPQDWQCPVLWHVEQGRPVNVSPRLQNWHFPLPPQPGQSERSTWSQEGVFIVSSTLPEYTDASAWQTLAVAPNGHRITALKSLLHLATGIQGSRPNGPPESSGHKRMPYVAGQFRNASCHEDFPRPASQQLVRGHG
jgi:hypothetical protein